MDYWLIALFLKPFIALVVFALILYPIRVLVQRRMRDSPLKRFLLTDLSKQSRSRRR